MFKYVIGAGLPRVGKGQDVSGGDEDWWLKRTAGVWLTKGDQVAARGARARYG